MNRRTSIARELHLAEYLPQGLAKMIRSKSSVVFLVAIGLVVILQKNITGIVGNIYLVFFTILFTVLWILFNSDFFKNIIIRQAFQKNNFSNKLGEIPYILSSEISEDGSRKMEFSSSGITLSEWKDRKEDIENVLNITIFEIYKTDRNNRVCICYSKGIFDFSKCQRWSDTLLDDSEFIKIGVNGSGIKKFRFSDYYHLLIGGASGSGKTILIKSILYQSLKKGYQVILADFKGAVDYSSGWDQYCYIVTDMDDFLNQLEELSEELKRRLLLLKKSGYKKIEDFNADAECDIQMQRIILTVDEYADVLEKTSSKEAKEREQEILGILTEIARKGRAVGIHLIISTQRPDATVLPGAIKNNLQYRISGRCDDNLSRIILDSGDAATEIPSNVTGVFLDSEGNLFKGYYFDDSTL